MKLTRENYHSREANQEYMSVSLFKSFLPEYGGCEARTMAELHGEWEAPENPAFLLGSYVHAWNSNELQEFMAETPELFKKNGDLYAKYAIGDDMINAIKDDPLAMKSLEGEKEVIFTEELFGMPWKIRIDSYNPKRQIFTDLKTIREINKTYWNPETRERENFVVHWGYDFQLAAYAEVERRANKRKELYTPHILVVSKEDPPDKELLVMPKYEVGPILDSMEPYVDRVYKVWKGQEEPERCGKCEYCRATKKLDGVKLYWEVGE